MIRTGDHKREGFANPLGSQQIANNVIIIIVLDTIMSSDLATQLAATQCLQVWLQHRHRASLMMLMLMAMEWRGLGMCMGIIRSQLSG